MFKQILNPQLLLGALILIFISCTKDLDFDQANDFEISPIIESSLIFLNEPASQFFSSGVEIVSIQDSVEITLFNNRFIRDNLVKADFVFETNNTINRGFNVQVDFLDGLDQLVHEFAFNATVSSINSNIVENYTETFEDNALMGLKSTKKMVFTLSVLPGVPISEDTLGKIKLKSKGIFYFNISEGR